MSTHKLSIDDLLEDKARFLPAAWLRYEDEQARDHIPSTKRCLFDESMTAAYPNYTPTHQYVLRATLRSLEVSEATFNAAWPLISDRLPDGVPQEMGKNPGPLESVQHYKIPNSDLAIRLWYGTTDFSGIRFIDFIHLHEPTLINMPNGFKLVYPGVRGSRKYLTTWEHTTPVHLRTRTDRFAVQEGAKVALKRPGKEDFYFEIPTTQYDTDIQYAHPELL